MRRSAVVLAVFASVAIAMSRGDAAWVEGVVQAAQEPAAGMTVRIGITHNGSVEPTSLPLESYIARVLAGEALPGSQPAALEALAIAVRTYTIANLGRHASAGFDLCDQTHCQVMRPSTDATERAAQATAGKILLYRGTPASIYYSASCGGYTEKPSAVWPGIEDPPYLPSQPDDACGVMPWSAELAMSDLRRSFAAAGYRGTLRGLSIASRNDSGRVAMLTLDGLTPGQVSGQDLRSVIGATLGWQHIKSTAFDVRKTGDAYHFEGRGSGHGVGMCVIGSARLAERGVTAEAILARYFPGTIIGLAPARNPGAPTPSGSVSSRPSAPAPAVPAAASVRAPNPAGPATAVPAATAITVLMADAVASDLAPLQDLALRSRDELSRALGVTPPARVTLRFHQTQQEYERATGQAWFTLGSASGTEINLVPFAMLRDRGLLERTIRRQLVHVLVDEPLSRRPVWVREGASLFYSDPSVGAAPASRVTCPTDSELMRPLSPGALSASLSDARACFAKQVTDGRKWTDVR